MAKTLVIKGADFSNHYVEQVSFLDIPCTGLSLNKSETILENTTSTEELIATVTPANTTDIVIWVSSNPDIVKVDGGVISVTGIGSATITAQCGEYSAECSVTTSGVVDFAYSLGAWATCENSRNYVALNSTSATNGFLVGETSGIYHATDLEPTGGWLYPIKVPKNATSIAVRCLSMYYGVATIAFTNSNVESTVSGTVAYSSYLSGTNDTGWGDKTYNGTACFGNDINIPSGCDSVVVHIRDYGSVSTPETAAANTHIWFE